MSGIVNDKSFDIIFRDGRTHTVWLEKPVSDITLQALYELLSLGPTSANCSPARFLFLRSATAKERLRPYLSAGNVEQTMSAPIVTIVGYDLAFCNIDPAKRAIGCGFYFGVHFRRFDLDQLIAFGNRVADFLEPLHDLSVAHPHAPLRQDDWCRHNWRSRAGSRAQRCQVPPKSPAFSMTRMSSTPS